MEPFVSQTEQVRCAVEGRLVDGGGTCTVVLTRKNGEWMFYPHGATKMAVRLTGPDAAKMATTILGGKQ